MTEHSPAKVTVKDGTATIEYKMTTITVTPKYECTPEELQANAEALVDRWTTHTKRGDQFKKSTLLEIHERYQVLFGHMYQCHGLVLTEDEMIGIGKAVNEMRAQWERE